MKYKYFSYCPEDGFDTHETLEDALLNANGIIPNYLDEGWSEDVTGVFVGTITHAATMCDKVERDGSVDEYGCDDKGSYWDPEWAYKCDYKMLPVESESPKLVEALERLVLAAQCRDNSTGDQIRLIETRAELSAAAKNAEEVLSTYRKQDDEIPMHPCIMQLDKLGDL